MIHQMLRSEHWRDLEERYLTQCEGTGVKEVSSIKESFSERWVLWMRECQLGKGRQRRKGKAL